MHVRQTRWMNVIFTRYDLWKLFFFLKRILIGKTVCFNCLNTLVKHARYMFFLEIRFWEIIFFK